jgi:hypothetical protein
VNYGFGKRQKELKRRKKKEAKAEKKRLRKEAASAGDQTDSTGLADSVTPDEDSRPDLPPT